MKEYYIITSLIGLILMIRIYFVARKRTINTFPAIRKPLKIFIILQIIYYFGNFIVTLNNSGGIKRESLLILIIELVAFDASYLIGLILVKVLEKSHIILVNQKFRILLIILFVFIITVDISFSLNQGELNPTWLLEYCYQIILSIWILKSLFKIRKTIKEQEIRIRSKKLIIGFFLVLTMANSVFLLMPPEIYFLHLDLLISTSMLISLIGILFILSAYSNNQKNSKMFYAIRKINSD